jgi:metallo-beta-lactamase class B
MRKLIMTCLLATAAGLSAGAATAQSPPAWSQPQEPFRVVGPIHYVGTEGIAVYLIKTSRGLILLDGGLEQAVPIVERNIAKLGFRLQDVQIILETHAHWDHVAGLAALKRDTGARLLASPGDRLALESGIPPSDTEYDVGKFPAVKVDAVLHDGEAVRLGDVAMTPLLTPGHTPGCTSWAMTVKENGRPLDVVFPCSLTVAGNVLVGNKGYPGIVADFRRTFARMRGVKADVVLPAHAEFADVIGRARRRDAGEANAFLAPGLLPDLVKKSEQAFEAELREQEAKR